MIILAVLPAVMLMRYIYKADVVEKEPTGLLVKIFIFGVVGVVPAVIGELVFETIILDDSGLNPDGVMYALIENFLGVAFWEEICKYLAMKLPTWKNKEFDYDYDGIVYGVTASLGFAAIENIFYVDSLGTAVIRFMLSVPGHAAYGVWMGMYYSRAKRYTIEGDIRGRKTEIVKAILVPTLLHGFYDFALSAPGDWILSIFIYVPILYALTIKKIRSVSINDRAFSDSADRCREDV